MLQTPLVKYDLNNKSFTGKIAVNKANFKGAQGKICFGQVFSKKNIINFTGEPTNTSRLEHSLQYIKNVNNHLTKTGGKPLSSLNDLDPKQIEGILDGIDVFKDMTVQDLYLMPNITSILLQRGCNNLCSHCYVCSKMPIESMQWEDVVKITKGFGELKRRLGFEPFYSTKYASYVPYIDSDPIAFKSYDKDGNVYNLAEAIKLLVKEGLKPSSIVTAGWNIDDSFSQSAAVELTKLIGDGNSGYNNTVYISLHPFQQIMTRSLKKAQTDPDAAKKLRQEYIDRMTNVLITFLPLFNKDRLHLTLIFDKKAQNGSGYSEEDVLQLNEDIIKNVVKVCQQKGIHPEEYTKLANIKNNFINERFSKGRINYEGRARKFLPEVEKVDKVPFKLEKVQGKNKITIGSFGSEWNWSKIKILEKITSMLKNNPDYLNNLDKIVLNINPLLDPDFVSKRKLRQQGKSAGWGYWDYTDDISYTLRVIKPFIDQSKVFLSFQYCPDSDLTREEFNLFVKDCLENFNKEFGTKFSKDKLWQIEEVSLENLKKVREENKKFMLDAFIDMLNQLDSQMSLNIIQGAQKLVNIDGKILIEGSEQGRGINDHFFEIPGLRLNFDRKTPYKHDDFKSMPFDRSVITASKEVLERDKKCNLVPTSKSQKDKQDQVLVSFGRRLERWA